MTQIHRKYY